MNHEAPLQPPVTLQGMSTTRLETFSDGVLAVIITIMALDLKAPHGTHLADLWALAPVFAAYAISFSVIGTYWNNHHHMVRAMQKISPGIMWANLHLLFWLSLIPFMTSWLGEHYTAALPTVCYAILLLICGFAYQILQMQVLRSNKDHQLHKRFKRDYKGVFSLGCYVLAIPLAFASHWLADGLFVAVSIAWFIPDQRLSTDAAAQNRN